MKGVEKKIAVLLQGLPWTDERLSRLELMGMVKRVGDGYRLTRRGERVCRALLVLKRKVGQKRQQDDADV